MKRLIFSTTFAIALAAAPALAQVPPTMSYQGVLLDNTGAIPPDGAYNFTFRIYDDPTLSGSHLLWTETQNNVNVARGGFSVVLGTGTPPVPLTIAFDRPYYLSVATAAAPAAPGAEMLPRVVLASSPYSLNSSRVDVRPNGPTGTTSTFGHGADNNFTLETSQDRSSNAQDALVGQLALTYGGAGNAAVRFHRGFGAGDGYLSFTAGNNQERVRFTANGRVGIGATVPSATLDVNGNLVIRSPAHLPQCFPTMALGWDPGSMQVGVLDVVCLGSMENPVPLANPADVLMLKPVRFASGSGREDIGLAPDEMTGTTRDLIRTDADGRPVAIQYDKLSLYLLEVVKTQQKAIEKLSAEVESLKQR